MSGDLVGEHDDEVQVGLGMTSVVALKKGYFTHLPEHRCVYLSTPSS